MRRGLSDPAAAFQGPEGFFHSPSPLTRALRDSCFYLLYISSLPHASAYYQPHTLSAVLEAAPCPWELHFWWQGMHSLPFAQRWCQRCVVCQDPLFSAGWPAGSLRACGCPADKLKGMFNSSSFLGQELEQVSFALQSIPKVSSCA